jgi:hypothetical protein
MDLANLSDTYRPDEGATVELNGPDGAQLFNDDGTPMKWSVLGADSDVAVKARNANTNKRLAQGVRVKLTAEGLDSDKASYIAKLSTSWDITLGGEKPAFSYETALKVLRNPRLAFIADQLEAVIDERSRFLKGSPTT